MANEQRRRGERGKRKETEQSVASPASGVEPRESEGEVSSEASVSERLCAGCRRSVPREELLRFAVGPDAPYLAPDPQRKLGGRGVSVHPTRQCIELAAKKGGFARALKRNVTIDPVALCDAAGVLYEMRASSLLIAAARRRRLAIGTDAVRDALRSELRADEAREGQPERAPVEALIVAADAEGRREELQANAARLGRRCTVLGTKVSLGRLFGRDEVGVLGVLDRGIADEVVRCAVHAAELKSPEGSTPQGKDERGHGGASARVSEAE